MQDLSTPQVVRPLRGYGQSYRLLVLVSFIFGSLPNLQWIYPSHTHVLSLRRRLNFSGGMKGKRSSHLNTPQPHSLWIAFISESFVQDSYCCPTISSCHCVNVQCPNLGCYASFQSSGIRSHYLIGFSTSIVSGLPLLSIAHALLCHSIRTRWPTTRIQLRYWAVQKHKEYTFYQFKIPLVLTRRLRPPN